MGDYLVLQERGFAGVRLATDVTDVTDGLLCGVGVYGVSVSAF
jgi:hypothetical protein